MNDLGDVRESVLEPGIFTDRNPGWVLMDGRNVEGSDLFAINGATNIPDGRGVFIRGMDLGRNAIDGKGDPEGDTRTLNSVQMDTFKAHDHTINDPGHNHGMRDDNLARGRSSFHGAEVTMFNGGQGEKARQATGITINTAGGSETRPRNIALYRYIKIDDA